jgi:membrane associated rhomboid family serine protease
VGAFFLARRLHIGVGGAFVCGVIFAYVLMFPDSGLGIYCLPWSIPGWLYAIAFLLVSFYALRANRDNVGHDAHLGGAMVGLLIAAGLRPEAVRQNWVLLAAMVGYCCVLLFLIYYRGVGIRSLSGDSGQDLLRGGSGRDVRS